MLNKDYELCFGILKVICFLYIINHVTGMPRLQMQFNFWNIQYTRKIQFDLRMFGCIIKGVLNLLVLERLGVHRKC